MEWGLAELQNQLASVWSTISADPEIIISSFVTAFAGAAAGAYTAHKLVEGAQTRRESLHEIRSINAAIAVVFDIVNSYFILKDQHIKKFNESYEKQRTDFDAFLEERRQGLRHGQLFRLSLDFETFPEMHIPLDALQELLFRKISVTGRPLDLWAVLLRSAIELNRTVRKRNEFIDAYKANPPTDADTPAIIYFGLPDKHGHVDRSYPDLVKALSSLTDDCIYFGMELAKELHQHGIQCAKPLGKKAPKIQELDFSIAEEKGLMPNLGNYKDWEKFGRS